MIAGHEEAIAEINGLPYLQRRNHGRQRVRNCVDADEFPVAGARAVQYREMLEYAALSLGRRVGAKG